MQTSCSYGPSVSVGTSAPQTETITRLIDWTGRELGDIGFSAALDALGQIQEPTHLKLPRNFLSKRALEILAPRLGPKGTFPNLKILDLSHNNIYNNQDILEIPQLKKLKLFLEALETYPNLHSLNLSYNRIHFFYEHHIAQLLNFNTTIKDLDLSGNKTTGKILSAALRQNSHIGGTLQALNLRDTGLSSSSASGIFLSVLDHQTMTSLDLGRNRLGTFISEKRLTRLLHRLKPQRSPPFFTLKVVKTFTSNNRLTHLNLRHAHLGPSDAFALAEVIHGNRTICNLLLGGNFIGDAGGKALMRALAGSHSIVQLDVSSNQLGPRTTKALILMIQSNCRLRDLSLLDNPLDPTRGGDFVTALSVNPILLRLRENCLSPSERKSAERILTKNQKRADHNRRMRNLSLRQILSDFLLGT